MSAELIAFLAALVSAVAVFFSAFVPAILDHRKAKRDRIAAEQERIRDAANKILRHLANFRHTGQEDQVKASGFPSHQQATAEMRGAYDAWALVVMPRLDTARRERVQDIRHELGRGELRETEGKDISVSTELFDLTWIATENVH